MHAQEDLNLHILSMFEGTFLLDAADMIAHIIAYKYEDNLLNIKYLISFFHCEKMAYI